MNTSKVEDQIGLRQAVQAALAKHGIDDLGVDMTVTTAVLNFISGESKQPHTAESLRQQTMEAVMTGIRAQDGLRADWQRLFKTSPNWNTKTNRDFLEWLRELPADQTLDRFAAWWYAQDFRGRQGAPPLTNWVREFWPVAMEWNGRESAVNTQHTAQRSSPLPKGV